MHRSKGKRSACIFVTWDRTGCGARWRDHARHQIGGCSMADPAAGSQSQAHLHRGIASTNDGSAAR
jgi:hypothetical protein